jgi:hypothetical protein
MAVVQDGLHRVGEPLGIAPQVRKVAPWSLRSKPQPIYSVVGTVFALAPHFVIQNAVLIRLDVLAALKAERQKTAALAPRGQRIRWS